MSIKVKFELGGNVILKNKKNSRNFTLSLPEGITIQEVVEKKLGYTPLEAKYFTYLVNEKSAKGFAKLSDGDDVKILLPMGGG